jgi:hypothetical protein
MPVRKSGQRVVEGARLDGARWGVAEVAAQAPPPLVHSAVEGRWLWPSASLRRGVGTHRHHAAMGGETEALAGPRSGPDTGLAIYHQTSTTDEGENGPLKRCPNKVGLAMLDYESGAWFPARCGRLTCPYCVKVQAFVRAAAIALAAPQRALRVSLVADADSDDPWVTARRRINRTREWYRRLTGHDLGEWLTQVERNPKGTGYHAHAWQHGTRKVDRTALDAAAQRAGAGWTKVETVRSNVGAAHYGLKGVGGMGYGLKEAQGDPAEHLRLNGGRLTHQSRGFFRSEDGSTLGVRAAERLALDRMSGGRERGRWGLVTESAARSWESLPRAVAGPA